MADILTALTSKGIRKFSVGYPDNAIKNVNNQFSETIRMMVFSPNGQYFALSNMLNVKVYENMNETQKFLLEKRNCTKLAFSPLSNIIALLGKVEHGYMVDFYSCDTQENMFSYKALDSEHWLPIWTDDQFLCGIVHRRSIAFYKNLDFKKRAYQFEMADLSLAFLSTSNNGQLYYLTIFCRNSSASTLRVFEAFSPTNREILSNDINLHGQFSATDRPLLMKTIFKLDFVDFTFNQAKTDAIVTCTVETSGSSYYGSNNLYLLALSNRSSYDCSPISLNKPGLVHAVAWEPSGKRFVVTYGKMPSTTAIFDKKCDVVYEFQPDYRNSIYFNPSGSILLLGGFGNLQGYLDVFDYAKRMKMCQIHVPCTTSIRWSGDGEHFITATMTPKLRVYNGFRVWHYTGRCVGRVEFSSGVYRNNDSPGNACESGGGCGAPAKLLNAEFLCELLLKPLPTPDGTVRQKIDVSQKSHQQQQQQQPLSYKPWHGLVIKLMDDELNSGICSRNPDRENGEDETFVVNTCVKTVQESCKSIVNNVYVPPHMRNKKENVKTGKGPTDVSKLQRNGTYDYRNFNLSGDVEKVKKMRSILKRLHDIEKLREKKANGDRLELNQEEKINSEDRLLQEFHRLYT